MNGSSSFSNGNSFDDDGRHLAAMFRRLVAGFPSRTTL